MRPLIRYRKQHIVVAAMMLLPILLSACAATGRERIAFISERDGNAEIYVMNADGSGQTRLTSNPGDDMGHAWSPDGMRTAFMAKREGIWEIYVLNADGSDRTRSTGGNSISMSQGQGCPSPPLKHIEYGPLSRATCVSPFCIVGYTARARAHFLDGLPLSTSSIATRQTPLKPLRDSYSPQLVYA